jgi:hypothetical protein
LARRGAINCARLQAPWTRFVSLAAVIALAAACSTSPRLTSGTASRTATANHAAFLTEINHVCAHSIAAHASHPFPLADFNPEQPDPSQLPTVGNYFARYGRLPQTVATLHGLTPPTEDAAAWHRLLAITDEMRANVIRQISAARAKAVSSFVTTVHTARQLTDQLNRAGASFGLSSSSACGQLFG